MPVLTTNWITLRDHLRDSLLTEVHNANLWSEEYDSLCLKAANKLVPLIRKGQGSFFEVKEMIDPIVMTAKFNGSSIDESALAQHWWGLFKGAGAGIAAVRNR